MKPEKIRILAIGRNEEIIKVLERLINQEWYGIGVTKDDEAIEAFRQQRFDVVMFSNGLTGDEKSALQQQLSAIGPPPIFIQHMGGGSGLLQNEIYAALEANDKKKL